MPTIPETRRPVMGEQRPTREECIQAAAIVLANAVRDIIPAQHEDAAA